MKLFAQLVTGILVSVLVSTPMFAAVPCRPAVQSKACCGGDECPMAAKTTNSKADSQEGTKDVPRPCCKVTPHSLVAIAPQRALESQIGLAVEHQSFAVSFTQAMQSWERILLPLNPGASRRLQAVLCTFLI